MYICRHNERIPPSIKAVRTSIQEIPRIVSDFQYPICGIEHLFVHDNHTVTANPVQDRRRRKGDRSYGVGLGKCRKGA